MNKTFFRRLVQAVLGATLVFLIIGAFFRYIGHNFGSQNVLIFNEHWSVSINDVEYTDVTMDDFAFPPVNDGDVIVFKNELPDETPSIAMMEILTYLSTIDVSVEGEDIYEYGHEYDVTDRLVGSGYHFIQLPPDCAGKTITITLKATEKAAFTSVSAIEITESVDAFTYFAEKNITAMFVSMFLFTLGAVLTVTSILALCYNNTYMRLVYIGLFSGSMGTWALCNTKILEIFSTDIARNTCIEYLSLYIAPIPLILLIIDMRKGEQRWKGIILKGVVSVLSAFAMITAFLQFSNIVHFPATVMYFHIIGAICLSLVLVVCVSKVENFSFADKILAVGLVVMCVAIAADLIRFNVQKYVMPDNELLLNSVLPLGTLVFIVFMLISYLAYLYNMVMTKAEKDTLTRLAYQDALTGLCNRAECEKIFTQADNDDFDYIIVNMDLNGLKQTNDSYGHAKGDLLLTSFANILQTVFLKEDTIVRMGGDEFLVLHRGNDIKTVMDCLEKMEELEVEKTAELGFLVETSYGVARSSEVDGRNAEEVYKLADMRMYEMKENTKKK